MKKIVFLSLILVTTIGVGNLYSQDKFKNKENDKGNRWEGFDSQKISGGFRVIGFHQGVIPEYQSGDILEMLFFVPAGKEALVQVHNLKQGRRKYRMEPKTNPFSEGKQQFTDWAVNDVLLNKNNNITNNNLGSLIKTKDDIYLPASIRVNNNRKGTGYNIYFYSPDGINSIAYKIVDQSGKEIAQYKSGRKNPDSKFSLPFDAPKITGYYRIKVYIYYSGKKDSNTYSLYSYSFYYKD